jgi:hypothetical protein
MVRAEAANPTGKALYETVSAIARSLGWQSIAPNVSGRALEEWEALNSLVQIADELGKEATIQTFANELEERQRSQHEPTRESITLSTIHAAKGLEYKAVFTLELLKVMCQLAMPRQIYRSLKSRDFSMLVLLEPRTNCSSPGLTKMVLMTDSAQEADT